MTIGHFIEPDRSLEMLPNPNQKLGVPIFSGYRAVGQAAQFLGSGPIKSLAAGSIG